MGDFKKRYGWVFIMLVSLAHVNAQELLPSQRKAIEKVFEGYGGNPGCALGIFKDGQVLLAKGFGYSDLENKRSITPNTIFNVASVTKQFTAACIFLLEMEGKLSIEDDVRKFLPNFPSYVQNPIQIKHLLYHSSGLRSYLKLLHVKGIPWGTALNNEQVLGMLAKQKETNFKAGSKFSYSNSGYALLASIVERASGQSLASYAKEKIFEPLGMHNSYISTSEPPNLPAVAKGYVPNNTGYVMEEHAQNVVVGDGGVHTTISDFFKWSENFKTGKVGGSLFVDKMMQLGKLNNGKETNYGGGLFLGDYQNTPGLFTIGHSGEWAGYRSLFFKFMEQDVAFILLSNNANTNVWNLLNQLVPIVLEKELNTARIAMEENQVSEVIPKRTTQFKPMDLSSYSGHYFNPVEGYTRRIALENDTLAYVRSNGVSTKLAPWDENRFIFNNMPNVMLEFRPKETPKRLMLWIDKEAPIQLQHYNPVSYDQNEIKRFEGKYYSEELDIYYSIKSDKSQILVYLNNKELVRLTPVMENVFNDIHFGYLKFEADSKTRITGFTINDELVRNIHFKKS